MKFGYTIIYVADVRATLAFFEQAFGLETKFLHESGDYGELQTGETTLSFASHALAQLSLPNQYEAIDQMPKPASFEIGLTTQEVPKAVEKAIQAGASLLMEPTEKPWGQVVAYVKTPGNLLVELCTPLG